MRLNLAQWLWMSAVAMFAASILLDLANIVEIPPIYWLLGSTSLMVIGWWVMPSMKELEKAPRRRS